MNSPLRLRLEEYSFFGGIAGTLRFLPGATAAIRKGDFFPPQSSHIMSGSGRLLAISGATISYPFPTASENGELLSRLVCHIEDRRFIAHGGFDLIAIARATITNLSRRKVAQGGSTITQQLVRTIFLTPHRSVLRKVCEIWLAREIEKKLTKSEILHAYCNYAYLGRGVSGFEAAARFIFRKKLVSLRSNELAALIPLLQSPNKNHPAVSPLRFAELGRRTNRKLGLPSGTLSPVNPINVSVFRSPRLSQIVLNDLRTRGLATADIGQISTTIDAGIQAKVDKILKLETSKNVGIESVAVIFLDNESGDVLAESSWSRGKPTEHSPSFQGRIQPGSTLKTFCVVAALEQGLPVDYSLASSPFRSKSGCSNKEWRVRNYRDHYTGRSTIRDALIHSDNSVFARLIEQLDWASASEVYQKFGLCKRQAFTPSAVLGGLKEGLTLLQLASAYSVFARKGVFIPPRLIKGVAFRDGTWESFHAKRGVPILDYAIAEEMRRLLGATRAAYGGRYYGKTGTTRAGSIFAGYDEKVSAAIWINYDGPQDEFKEKGTTARTLLERIGDALLGHHGSRLLEII